MQVRAIAQGYHDGFREIGDEFPVPDGQKSPWWVPVEEPVEVKEPERIPNTFSELTKRSVRVEDEMIARKSVKR